ncbi:unnamed protein product [Adineta ricciae]|uniref:Potassium channel tetramerisation-type BTB domain-containing protein n=1 Tax=Adineta ricciae TaxID=249248 RepID=A0A814MNT9_ADIRI|nr:unnamed protein product [Adineta ricciae]CAF1287698.1 unnamed protein product [Adineta ricciae]
MKVLSVFFVIWTLLLARSTIVGFAVDYFESEPYEESLLTTENGTIVATDATSTEINSRYRGVVITNNKNHIDLSESTIDDIIELNVGGQRITTFRSTLTAVPNSKLAALFAKNVSKPKSKHFFDYNPVLFGHLLDQLRAIKRGPQVPAYELNFAAPNSSVPFDFSTMLVELGLSSDYFLYPSKGAHLNLTLKSLIGWKQCFREKYDKPFDSKVLTGPCKGRRLLVACRSTNDTRTLILAGVGKREDIFFPCSPNSHCRVEKKNGTGFYYAQDHAWGFEGALNTLQEVRNDHVDYRHNFGLQGGLVGYRQNQGLQGGLILNPCDSSDQNSEYRLCWSLRSISDRGGGDRCGSSKNLHNTRQWERVIYQTV